MDSWEMSMEAPGKTGFRWYWLLGPEVLISAYGLADIVIFRFWPREPFMWRCLGVVAAAVGAGIAYYWGLLRRPGSVKAPPLFKLFWLLIIFLELMWVW